MGSRTVGGEAIIVIVFVGMEATEENPIPDGREFVVDERRAGGQSGPAHPGYLVGKLSERCPLQRDARFNSRTIWDYNTCLGKG